LLGTLRGVPNDRYRNLTPVAVIAALRSFPRRYRGLLTGDPSRDVGEVGELRSPDARTVRQILSDTTDGLRQLDGSLRQVLYPVAGKTVAASAGGEPVSGTDAFRHDIHGWIDLFESAALAIADRLSDVPSAHLLRVGETPAGVSVTALDVGRQAVRVAAESLRAIEHAVGSGDSDDGNDD
jgi:hypothetical protein